MKKQRFTVLIVSEKLGSFKQWRLHHRSVLLTGAGFVAIGLLVCVFLTHYFFMLYSDVTTKDVEKNRLKRLSTQLKVVEERLLELDKLDHKLRDLAKIKSEELELDVGPISNNMMIYGPPRHVVKNAAYDNRLQVLQEESERQLQSMHNLVDHFKLQRKVLAYTPSIMPTRGSISSHFGPRADPFTGIRAMHYGLDIAAKTGTNVVASANGKVNYVGPNGAMGLTIIVDHGRSIETYYGHLNEAFVREGEMVKRGQKIAAVGNSGRSTAPHLHYAVTRNGSFVNPRRYIVGR